MNRVLAKKLPQWVATEGLLLPKTVSLEQCSSEATARFKASLCQGERLLDLTGGFGVDCAYMSASFRQTDYVEQDEELCRIARCNFALLGLPIQVHQAEAVRYLQQTAPCDCIYLDPARRNALGQRKFRLEDCSPDLTACYQLLMEKSPRILVKLSPLLDIQAALHALPNTTCVYVVALHNECKELVLDVRATDATNSPEIRCIHLPLGEVFRFRLAEEHAAHAQFGLPEKYLYEPYSTVLKAGAFTCLCTRYGVRKLHPNSHLYTSSTYIEHFPGRHFRLLSQRRVHKKQCKDLTQAHLSVRNFPANAEVLRKQLGLKEGGEDYLFATTLYDGTHCLLHGQKVEHNDTLIPT